MLQLLPLLSWSLLACGEEQDSGADPLCAVVPDSTWSSVEELECGLGPKGEVLCHWSLSFGADGSFGWQYSDVGESGTWTCADGTIHADTGGRVIAAELSDPTHLSWDGVAYTRD